MAALVVLMLASISCLSSPAHRELSSQPRPLPVSQPDTQTVEVPIGATVPLPGSALSVTFVRVTEDSRCPTGTTCIWEGDAVVELRVDTGSTGETLELHTNPRFAREGRAGGVVLTLERLAPHPAADEAIPPDAYRLSLRIASR